MSLLKKKYKPNIVLGDTFDLIKNERKNSIDLVISSPPYNIGKKYEKKIEVERYLEPYIDFSKNLYSSIKDSGSICWQVGNYIDNGEILPLDIPFHKIFSDAGFKLRNRIIWHFEHGLHASKRLSGRYETIMWFTKSDNYIFNLDDIRVPSKYPGKRHYSGKKKGQPSGNPLGKNPSDFMKIVEQDWDKQIWELPNVKANHIEKTNHPCQFPIELVQRCILALTNQDGKVLDPFAGVGSALVGSYLLNRKSIGYESDPAFVNTTKERVDDFEKGKIKIRKIGTQIHVPKKTDKVASIPQEWRD